MFSHTVLEHVALRPHLGSPLPVWVGHSCPTKACTHHNVHSSQTDRHQCDYPSKTRTRMSERHGSCYHMRIYSKRIPLTRMYEYRRMLPHYQKAHRAVFITFCKNFRGEAFPPQA